MHKYCLSGTQGQIVGAGEDLPLIELQDFNRDSMVDIAFYSPDGNITVLYNQYKAQEYNADNLCNEPTATSKLSSEPMFPAYPFTTADPAQSMIYQVTAPEGLVL